MKHQPRILIIASLDKSASQERALMVKRQLEKNNCKVEIFDTYQHFSHMLNPQYLAAFPKLFLNYLKPLMGYKLRQRSYPLFEEMLVRGEIVSKYIRERQISTVICQNPQDMTSLLSLPKSCLALLDTPTLFSEEIRQDKRYPQTTAENIKTIEDKVFWQADGVTFHWYRFLKLAQEKGRTISHPITANWGCLRPQKTATFSPTPQVIYLGKLNSDWINPCLLEKLQQSIKAPLDIFSYESPDHHYQNLQTKGYLANLNTVANYQFGLLTFSNDELRNYGFSAKHLLYLSFGLPVLCPEWRKDPLLAPATIYYTEKNINEQIKNFSQKQKWQTKHQEALRLAKSLNWEKTLHPLIKKVASNYPKEN